MKNDIRQELILSVRQLGAFLKTVSEEYERQNNPLSPTESQSIKPNLIDEVWFKNSWFTPQNTIFQFKHWSSLLLSENLDNWANTFRFNPQPKKVGIIMAGNIPLVGLHDLLAVVLSGNIALVKLSSKDDVAMKGVIDVLNGGFMERRIIVSERLNDCQAILATGSNNSARYFDFYFQKIPRIIRKNRSSVAVLDGNESKEDLARLAQDIFLYFGLGCRNVTQLIVPKNFDFHPLAIAWEEWEKLLKHDKFANNYHYHKTVMSLQGKAFMDGGFYSLVDSDALFSQISVVNYHFYSNPKAVEKFLEDHSEQIQVVTSNFWPNSLPLGSGQCPDLTDYADGVNVADFLNALN